MIQRVSWCFRKIVAPVIYTRISHKHGRRGAVTNSLNVLRIAYRFESNRHATHLAIVFREEVVLIAAVSRVRELTALPNERVKPVARHRPRPIAGRRDELAWGETWALRVCVKIFEKRARQFYYFIGVYACFFWFFMMKRNTPGFHTCYKSFRVRRKCQSRIFRNCTWTKKTQNMIHDERCEWCSWLRARPPSYAGGANVRFYTCRSSTRCMPPCKTASKSAASSSSTSSCGFHGRAASRQSAARSNRGVATKQSASLRPVINLSVQHYKEIWTNI